MINNGKLKIDSRLSMDSYWLRILTFLTFVERLRNDLTFNCCNNNVGSGLWLWLSNIDISVPWAQPCPELEKTHSVKGRIQRKKKKIGNFQTSVWPFKIQKLNLDKWAGKYSRDMFFWGKPDCWTGFCSSSLDISYYHIKSVQKKLGTDR